MRALLFCAAVLAATVAHAETITVWEDSGHVYARDEDTGEEWILSDPTIDPNTGRPAEDFVADQPDVDGLMACWRVTGIGQPAVNIWSFEDEPPYSSSWARYQNHRVAAGQIANPQVGYVGSVEEELTSFIAWEEDGSAWTLMLGTAGGVPRRVVDPLVGHIDIVQGYILKHGTGSISLRDVYGLAPEPGTLVLLLIGLSCLTHHGFKYGRSNR